MTMLVVLVCFVDCFWVFLCVIVCGWFGVSVGAPRQSGTGRHTASNTHTHTKNAPGDDADGHVALGLLHLLRHRRHAVKALLVIFSSVCGEGSER